MDSIEEDAGTSRDAWHLFSGCTTKVDDERFVLLKMQQCRRQLGLYKRRYNLLWVDCSIFAAPKSPFRVSPGAPGVFMLTIGIVMVRRSKCGLGDHSSSLGSKLLFVVRILCHRTSHLHKSAFGSGCLCCRARSRQKVAIVSVPQQHIREDF